jgi:hypothetical protein
MWMDSIPVAPVKDEEKSDDGCDLISDIRSTVS